MKFFNFLISKAFWINLFLIIAFSVLLVLGFIYYLKSYTNHNQYITLNDLSGFTYEQAVNQLDFRKLKFEILDSNSYDPNLLPMSVVKQDPAPLAKVKENRTIYLWLNASNPPLVEVPDLAGKQSLDMAIVMLENRGLKLGDIIERPSAEQNAVLEVIILGDTMKSATSVPKGTSIDLVVGGGIGATRIEVPCLLGKTMSEVRFTAMAYDLNIGYIKYETKDLSDSSSAVVYKQIPECNSGLIRVGEAIDVYLIQDLPESVLKEINKMQLDSLIQSEIEGALNEED